MSMRGSQSMRGSHPISVALVTVMALAALPLGAQEEERDTASFEPRPERTVVTRELSRNPAAGVTTARIVEAHRAEPQNWLTYYGDYGGSRHSLLDEVNASNVGDTEVVWDRTWPRSAKFESTPLVVDGVMYVTLGGRSAVLALDAATGEEIWRFEPEVRTEIPICCGQVNRGVAMGNGMVFIATLDATLYALDAATGRVEWRTRYAEPSDGYSATLAPLFVKGKVLTGISGGEYGIRGFVDAYDAATGERAWRFYTVPAPGQPGSDTWEAPDTWQTGGGPTWLTGTYDAAQDLVLWGVGNPSPDFNGLVRPGDNLYTNSVLALDPDDGALRWHYQYTPHDVWDYDAVQVTVLADVPWRGESTPMALHADKNGYFYALDRTDGSFLYATPIARRTWTQGLDEVTGRPRVNPEAMPAAYDKPICPSVMGATEWTHMSYHPGTRMVYIPVIEQCALFRMRQAYYVPGMPFWGGYQDLDAFGPAEAHGFLTAIDVTTGEVAWKKRSERPVVANVLTTAGDLVFWRESDGTFRATHARTGEDLWEAKAGGGTRGSVITYAVEGRQYIAWTATQPEAPHNERLVVYGLPR